MFWGCFSYDRKGPAYCWSPETVREKKAADEVIANMNDTLEAAAKEKWELENGMKRLKLRQLPGKKPVWHWNQKNGKLARRKGAGIDWYQYQQKILLPKLFPFFKECLEKRPGTLVQEDKAPAHNHYIQAAGLRPS